MQPIETEANVFSIRPPKTKLNTVYNWRISLVFLLQISILLDKGLYADGFEITVRWEGMTFYSNGFDEIKVSRNGMRLTYAGTGAVQTLPSWFAHCKGLLDIPKHMNLSYQVKIDG